MKCGTGTPGLILALTTHSQAGRPATEPGDRGGLTPGPLTRKQKAQKHSLVQASILAGSLTPTITQTLEPNP